MQVLEKTARTVDEAVEEALAELGVDRSHIEVKVIEEGSKGLLGLFGGRTARVQIFYRQAPAEEGALFLREFLRSAGLAGNVSTSERDGMTVLELSGGDLGALIGRHGQALDALQYLTNLAANRHIETRTRLIVDVEGYRKRREDALRKLALRTADKVKRERRKTILEPMTPGERRIIHSTLQGISDVFTYSEGEDPYRRVVISPNERD